MSNHHHSDERIQKSPNRRFLSVIGVVLLVACVTLGLLIIFWDNAAFENLGRFRTAFGILVIVYGLLRFPRLIWRRRL